MNREMGIHHDQQSFAAANHCVIAWGLARLMPTPTHRERQLMQYLHGREWVIAITLPPSAKVFSNLIGKGWIEQRGTANELSYRLTVKGLAAMKERVRIYR